ncbi:MAG: hypothetical protein RL198_601 [Actinomycetota bacterium]
MALGLLLVFGGFALVLAPIAGQLFQSLPYLTIIMGLLLIGFGILVLLHKTPDFSKLRFFQTAPGASVVSQLAYGVTFALASLSCTIGPFLAVLGGSATQNGGQLALNILSYGFGMWLVVLVLALAVSVSAYRVTAYAARIRRWVEPISGTLLLLVGAYVTRFGIYELQVIANPGHTDPIVGFVLDFQQSAVRLFSSLFGF